MYVSIRSIKIFGIWPHVRTYADRQTYTRVLHCSHASVGLAQARPNKPSKGCGKGMSIERMTADKAARVCSNPVCGISTIIFMKD